MGDLLVITGWCETTPNIPQPIADLDVSKNRGFSPKMDGENNGRPYEQMDDFVFFP